MIIDITEKSKEGFISENRIRYAYAFIDDEFQTNTEYLIGKEDIDKIISLLEPLIKDNNIDLFIHYSLDPNILLREYYVDGTIAFTIMNENDLIEFRGILKGILSLNCIESLYFNLKEKGGN